MARSGVYPPYLKNSAYHIWEALGNIPRTGWVTRGVKEPESVQSHTVALRHIAYFCDGFSENGRRNLIDMLEIHDWPEALLGDEVIVCNDPEEKKRLKATKFEKEHQAMKEICKSLDTVGETILYLWLRFETSDDPVARCARQIDKYQAIEKALYYEKTQGIVCFKEFFDYAKHDITHPSLVSMLKKLEEEWLTMNNTP